MREYSIGTVRGLEPSLPDRLATVLSGTASNKAFRKGSQIYRQGEDAEYVYFLVRGRVKSTLIGASGQEAILRIHLPQSILGLTALSTIQIRDANAVCLDSVSVVPIKRSAFLNLMSDDPEFGVHIVRLLADRMSDFHYRVGDWLSQSVEHRLSQALLALSADDGSGQDQYTHDIPLTHEEIAQLINTRRPTVSKTLSKLEALGFIKQIGRKLIISDRDKLLAHLDAARK